MARANGTDYFDEFIRSFHAKSIVFDDRFKLDNIDADARDLLESFFKEPNAGSPWAMTFDKTLHRERRHFARGNLIELDAAKHGKYKDYDYLDELSDSGPQEAVDFRRVTDQGIEFVQETSTISQTDTTLGNLEKKLRRTLQYAIDNKGKKATLDIHILEGREHNYQDLIDLAEQLENGVDGIAVDVVLTPKKFDGWLVE